MDAHHLVLQEAVKEQGKTAEDPNEEEGNYVCYYDNIEFLAH